MPATWRASEAARADFFAIKGVLESLLDGLRADWEVAPRAEPFLHPGRAASVTVGGQPIGWIGELHPLVARQWDLPDAAVFELDLDSLTARAVERETLYHEVGEFPPVRQDLAVVLPESLPSADVLHVVREAGQPLLESVRVFDVYRGEQVGEGQVSLALSLVFRAPDRTLTDEEANQRRQAVIDALKEQLGVEPRA
jgi:phenylalanyl-tRNA synthetase beta chain